MLIRIRSSKGLWRYEVEDVTAYTFADLANDVINRENQFEFHFLQANQDLNELIEEDPDNMKINYFSTKASGGVDELLSPDSKLSEKNMKNGTMIYLVGSVYPKPEAPKVAYISGDGTVVHSSSESSTKKTMEKKDIEGEGRKMERIRDNNNNNNDHNKNKIENPNPIDTSPKAEEKKKNTTESNDDMIIEEEASNKNQDGSKTRTEEEVRRILGEDTIPPPISSSGNDDYMDGFLIDEKGEVIRRPDAQRTEALVSQYPDLDIVENEFNLRFGEYTPYNSSLSSSISGNYTSGTYERRMRQNRSSSVDSTTPEIRRLREEVTKKIEAMQIEDPIVKEEAYMQEMIRRSEEINTNTSRHRNGRQNDRINSQFLRNRSQNIDDLLGMSSLDNFKSNFSSTTTNRKNRQQKNNSTKPDEVQVPPKNYKLDDRTSSNILKSTSSLANDKEKGEAWKNDRFSSRPNQYSSSSSSALSLSGRVISEEGSSYKSKNSDQFKAQGTTNRRSSAPELSPPNPRRFTVNGHRDFLREQREERERKREGARRREQPSMSHSTGTTNRKQLNNNSLTSSNVASKRNQGHDSLADKNRRSSWDRSTAIRTGNAKSTSPISSAPDAISSSNTSDLGKTKNLTTDSSNPSKNDELLAKLLQEELNQPYPTLSNRIGETFPSRTMLNNTNGRIEEINNEEYDINKAIEASLVSSGGHEHSNHEVNEFNTNRRREEEEFKRALELSKLDV